MSNPPENNAKASLDGRNVLFIAYFYPPTTSTGVPGSMRTVKFIRHLSGGQCHVLTTPSTVTAATNALSHLVLPVNGEVIHRVKPLDVFKLLLNLRGTVKKLLEKKKARLAGDPAHVKATFKSTSNESSAQQQSALQKLKDFIYNLCYFPDQAGPWILPASRRGINIVKKHNINAIFATGSPWSSLIAGYRISKATGVPLIVDFRDPWMNNPFHQSKGAMLDSWSKKLEEKVIRHASAVALNTEPLQQEFLERYPNQSARKFFVMPNGFDEHDFKDLPEVPNTSNESTITLCHAGFLYGVRDPAALLDAIKEINQSFSDTGSQKKVVFRQIGAVQLSYDLKERYRSLVADGSLIVEPPRPYLECLKALKAADVVVNIQPATRSQVPSKLYDYLAINRPILSITPIDGALGKLVTQKNIGSQADFNEKEKLKEQIEEQISKVEDVFLGYPARDDFNVAIIVKVLASRIKESSLS